MERFQKGKRVRVQGSGFRVQGSGFRVQGSGFRVQGCGGSFAAIYMEDSRFSVWNFQSLTARPRMTKISRFDLNDDTKSRFAQLAY